MSRPQISVIGSGDGESAILREAYRVGRLLGEHDAVLICGGGGGVMEAACRGLSEAQGGLAVGILRQMTPDAGNPYLDVRLPSGIGHARNLMVVLSGDAVIAVGGQFGTLSELAFAVKFDRPVYGVGSWEHPRFSFDGDLSADEAVERALCHSR